MVEDAGAATPSVNDRTSHQPGELCLIHERMCAESDEVVARGRLCADLRLQKLEHQRHRHGASAIGDDGQHALAFEFELGGRLRYDLANLVVGEHAIHRTFTESHQVGPYCLLCHPPRTAGDGLPRLSAGNPATDLRGCHGSRESFFMFEVLYCSGVSVRIRVIRGRGCQWTADGGCPHAVRGGSTG